MKKRKHQWHCNRCGSPCEVYRKGKSHRILDCPECGVIAKNPSVLGKVGKRVLKGALGEIPGASLIMEGAGLIKDVAGTKSASPQVSGRSQTYHYDNVDKMDVPREAWWLKNAKVV